jgi:hypothetical protein
MTVVFAIATLGVIGSVWLSRTITGTISRLLLGVVGSLSLWGLLIVNYAMLIANPVPQVIAFLIVPILSLAVMWFVMRRAGTQAK